MERNHFYSKNDASIDLMQKNVNDYNDDFVSQTDLIRVGGQDGGYATLAEEQQKMCIDLLNKHILCFTDAR